MDPHAAANGSSPHSSPSAFDGASDYYLQPDAFVSYNDSAASPPYHHQDGTSSAGGGGGGPQVQIADSFHNPDLPRNSSTISFGSSGLQLSGMPTAYSTGYHPPSYLQSITTSSSTAVGNGTNSAADHHLQSPVQASYHRETSTVSPPLTSMSASDLSGADSNGSSHSTLSSSLPPYAVVGPGGPHPQDQHSMGGYHPQQQQQQQAHYQQYHPHHQPAHHGGGGVHHQHHHHHHSSSVGTSSPTSSHGGHAQGALPPSSTTMTPDSPAPLSASASPTTSTGGGSTLVHRSRSTRSSAAAAANTRRTGGRGHSSSNASSTTKRASAAAAAAAAHQQEDDFASDEEDDAPMPSEVVVTKRREEVRRQRIESEQRRRDELRDGYRRLKDVLPVSNQKSSKVSLLDRATQHIKQMEMTQHHLIMKVNELEVEIARLRNVNETLMLSAAEQRRANAAAQQAQAHVATSY